MSTRRQVSHVTDNHCVIFDRTILLHALVSNKPKQSLHMPNDGQRGPFAASWQGSETATSDVISAWQLGKAQTYAIHPTKLSSMPS